ncbi:hypothetical protein [Gimesia aquarii]|uniref:Uncharacterized protein n=1 Tax=Gimesia aquarii TaxID=2527964 RepID=A0A517VPM3_9PLAN|nr:hypothetical protein [Gimesia aquarii]QDT94967.1 hypothetical protein V144x_04010 [Gimesia aquarii]
MPSLEQLEKWRTCYELICDCVSQITLKREVERLSDMIWTDYGGEDVTNDPFDGTWEGGAILEMQIFRRLLCRDDYYDSDIDEAQRRLKSNPNYMTVIELGTCKENDQLIIRLDTNVI